MRAPVESKAVFVSLRCYVRLLAAYPKHHREEYGPAMAQVFRDQCRDAWRAGRWWGMAKLWLRVLPDLVKTSLLEHLSLLKGKKSMFDKISEVFRPRSVPVRVFRGVFLAVFLLVFGAATIITFLLPESYSSTARIKLQSDAEAVASPSGAATSTAYDPYFLQTQFEVIQSEKVLGKVIEQLDLNTVWGKKYAAGEKLKTSETLGLLKSRMDLRPFRNTRLVEIRFFSEDPVEAARIANAIAEAYRDHRQDQRRAGLVSGIKPMAERADAQEKRVASAQEKLNRLRKEANVPDPEPVVEELRSRYPAYWSAKQELEAEANLRRTLIMKVASAKIDVALPPSSLVEIIDQAQPGLRPVRPNKLVNIVLGIVIGILLGSAVGAGTAGIAALIGRKSRGGSATPRTGASPPPVTPHSADGRHAKGTMDKIMGLLWMGMSVFLSGLGLLVLFWAFGDVPRFPDSLIIPLFGIFWGGNVVAGFFLFRGKSWARICIGVEAILLVTYFLFTVGAPVPRSLCWVLIVFGSITACALFWPRKQTAANPR